MSWLTRDEPEREFNSADFPVITGLRSHSVEFGGRGEGNTSIGIAHDSECRFPATLAGREVQGTCFCDDIEFSFDFGFLMEIIIHD